MIQTKQLQTGLFVTNNNGVIQVMTRAEKQQHEQRQQLKKLSLYNLLTLKYFT
jgi:translation elongation factor P/translation initiation factor 5A